MKSPAPSSGRPLPMNDSSGLRRALAIWSPMMLIGLAVLLCACAPVISQTRPATSCLALIPKAWTKPTPGAPLPKGKTVGDWIVFGDAQTGQLDAANTAGGGVIEIITACEARDAETVKALTRRKVLGIF